MTLIAIRDNCWITIRSTIPDVEQRPISLTLNLLGIISLFFVNRRSLASMQLTGLSVVRGSLKRAFAYFRD